MSTVIRNALAALVEQIKNGREFPDAHADVAIAFHLTDAQANQLTEAYDAWSVDQ